MGWGEKGWKTLIWEFTEKSDFKEGQEKLIYWGWITQKRMGDVFEGSWGAFLMTPWLTGIKYPEQMILCCTNTVILLIIVNIIKWDY